MTGAVPQAHGLEFRLTEQPMNCSCSGLVSRALAIGGQGYSTVCVPATACICVCVFEVFMHKIKKQKKKHIEAVHRSGNWELVLLI